MAAMGLEIGGLMKRILLLSAISLGVFCCGRQDSKPVVTPAGAASAPAPPAAKDDSIRVYGKLTKAELAIVDLLEQRKVTAASRALARLPIGDRSPAAPLIEAWCLLEQYDCLNYGAGAAVIPDQNRSLDELVAAGTQEAVELDEALKPIAVRVLTGVIISQLERGVERKVNFAGPDGVFRCKAAAMRLYDDRPYAKALKLDPLMPVPRVADPMQIIPALPTDKENENERGAGQYWWASVEETPGFWGGYWVDLHSRLIKWSTTELLSQSQSDRLHRVINALKLQGRYTSAYFVSIQFHRSGFDAIAPLGESGFEAWISRIVAMDLQQAGKANANQLPILAALGYLLRWAPAIASSPHETLRSEMALLTDDAALSASWAIDGLNLRNTPLGRETPRRDLPGKALFDTAFDRKLCEAMSELVICRKYALRAIKSEEMLATSKRDGLNLDGLGSPLRMPAEMEAERSRSTNEAILFAAPESLRGDPYMSFVEWYFRIFKVKSVEKEKDPNNLDLSGWIRDGRGAEATTSIFFPCDSRVSVTVEFTRGTASEIFFDGLSRLHGAYGLPKNEKRAITLIIEAAHLGHPDAMAVYANMLLGEPVGQVDTGVKPDKAAAVEWFKKAAVAANAPAQQYLTREGISWK